MVRKLHKWRKGAIDWIEGNTANLSIVFTWDVDQAIDRAIGFRNLGYQVKVGGPAIHTCRKAFNGLADVGGNVEDAVTLHNPDATFASRGCPVGCWFCIVPSMEGRSFTLIDDFVPRPILCDNNLSALPADFQDHIVKRYIDTGVPLLDANSGFEPRTFTRPVFERWRVVNRGPWRFALDDQGDMPHVERTMEMLKCVPNPKLKRVYVLIGNEPFEACMERVKKVLEWGGEPHCQPLIKLNARKKEPWVRFDWTAEKLRDVARWANRRLWKYTAFENYDRFARTQKPNDPRQAIMFS